MTGFKNTAEFKNAIYTYYRENGRDLPWRRTYDPYHILVSEIMLQQTQVNRVLDKYKEFIHLFPHINILAEANLIQVLKVWQGLGYNRRARNLWLCAQKVAEYHSGMLPESREKLLTLPGVGQATAGAVMAFAYNKPVVFIETNIRTVFLHFFFNHDSMVPDKVIMPLIGETVDKENPRLWYYALMDYGVYLKKKYPELNKKSMHYKKQSAFRGSRREVRSMIIRQLLSKGELSLNEIAPFKNRSFSEIEAIAADLEKEGFIRLESDRMRLREGN